MGDSLKKEKPKKLASLRGEGAGFCFDCEHEERLHVNGIDPRFEICTAEFPQPCQCVRKALGC